MKSNVSAFFGADCRDDGLSRAGLSGDDEDVYGRKASFCGELSDWQVG